MRHTNKLYNTTQYSIHIVQGVSIHIFENNIIYFSTPWNTPLEFFIEASRLYQSLTINVKAEYYEYDDETFSVQNGVILNTSIDLEQRKLHREFNYRLLSGL